MDTNAVGAGRRLGWTNQLMQHCERIIKAWNSAAWTDEVSERNNTALRTKMRGPVRDQHRFSAVRVDYDQFRQGRNLR